MKKFFIIVYFIRKFIPSCILLGFLRLIYNHGGLGKKIIKVFDPGFLRKKLVYRDKEKYLSISGDNWTLKLNVNDHIGYTSYIKNEPFEMSVYHLCELINSNDRSIIIDIGANIGSASIPICKKLDKKLICVEASKSNCKLLFDNIIVNNLKAAVYPFALVDTIGVDNDFIKFYINTGNTGANSIIQDWNPSITNLNREVEYSPTITLDSLIKQSAINIDNILVIKIDVEGAEELVLRGGLEFLNKNSAPILLEYRIDIVKSYLDKDMSELIKIFQSFDYDIYGINTDFALSDFDINKKYDNIIAIKKGSFADIVLER